jgi:protein phosphatase 2C family protein 2/3
VRPRGQVITAQPDVTVRGRDAADEFIVVGCDGIWDCMSNQEVCTFVRQRLSKGAVVSKICEEIFDRCISHDPKQTQGIGGDNMTCTIVMCKP